MGPRHLAQCYRCRRTFEAEHRGARYCPECEREQRQRFRVLPGGRDPRQGRLVVAPRAGSRGVTAGRRGGLGWPRDGAGGRTGRRPGGWAGRWPGRWRWRRWQQPLRLLAVVAAATAARMAWERLGGGPTPVEWLVYLAGAAWIWNRRDEAA
ncbi:hypothetical protein Tmar_1284 [Thermaerobacter marianensis DSM 12885]|uniref:Uncharacterized protein n=1 Tax=Thermaerobacter marianensis (strain ATCC 700841 / DSM 12885 / JCM 10246 / 7p75a) TaxID=644966 RepID=E6SLU8_THEM7|nr:hypothetical protein [Thermaerobacter marianensis]ADU51397.1 hypothetical protein Tmar_1284 [Thermaerobacter marianensis DSM 12885]